MGAAGSIQVEDNLKYIKDQYELEKSKVMSENDLLRHMLDHVSNHFTIIKNEYELKKSEGVSEDDLLKHMIDFIKKAPIKKKKNRVRKILEDNPIILKVTCEDTDEVKVLTFNKSDRLGKLKHLAITAFEVPATHSVFHNGIYLTKPKFQALSDFDSIRLVRYEKANINEKKK